MEAEGHLLEYRHLFRRVLGDGVEGLSIADLGLGLDQTYAVSLVEADPACESPSILEVERVGPLDGLGLGEEFPRLLQDFWVVSLK